MNDSPSGIVVALSGGMDSALAAALLKSKGWRVTALHFRLPSPEPVAAQREEKVRRIIRHLDIPLKIIDLREIFDQLIIEPFIAAYRNGQTPNPCVMCNPLIKFEQMKRFADQEGIHYLGTGHYVRLTKGTAAYPVSLLRGLDSRKDQSYFLHRLHRRVLKRTVFPLGELTKDDVRKRVEAMGIPCDTDSESQEICFIPDMDYRRFMEQRGATPDDAGGDIKNTSGEIVGIHQGIHRYTIGQRHGLGVASSRPYYVKELRPDTREVIVGRREELYSEAIRTARFNWLGSLPPEHKAPLNAQIRYRHTPAEGTLEIVSDREVTFTFHTPQWAVTPGQALVVYHEDRVLGGGWISKD
jgi:tRNA-uridine 2-sulfurtransferase